jgi:hypothetical protein
MSWQIEPIHRSRAGPDPGRVAEPSARPMADIACADEPMTTISHGIRINSPLSILLLSAADQRVSLCRGGRRRLSSNDTEVQPVHVLKAPPQCVRKCIKACPTTAPRPWCRIAPTTPWGGCRRAS